MKILENGVAVIEGDTHHAEWCKTEGLVHDVWMAKILATLIKAHGITSVVDGGAHIGTLTRVFLDAGAKVHAFEPNRQAVDCLRHNCPEATIYDCGLSDRAQKRVLVRKQNASASYIAKAEVERTTDDVIQLMPLDLYAIKPGLIKLDVEGWEVSALRGGAEIIRRHKPLIVCEVNREALTRAGESDLRLYETLADLGYGRLEILQPGSSFGHPQYDVLAHPC